MLLLSLGLVWTVSAAALVKVIPETDPVSEALMSSLQHAYHNVHPWNATNPGVQSVSIPLTAAPCRFTLTYKPAPRRIETQLSCVGETAACLAFDRTAGTNAVNMTSGLADPGSACGSLGNSLRMAESLVRALLSGRGTSETFAFETTDHDAQSATDSLDSTFWRYMYYGSGAVVPETRYTKYGYVDRDESAVVEMRDGIAQLEALTISAMMEECQRVCKKRSWLDFLKEYQKREGDLNLRQVARILAREGDASVWRQWKEMRLIEYLESSQYLPVVHGLMQPRVLTKEFSVI